MNWREKKRFPPSIIKEERKKQKEEKEINIKLYWGPRESYKVQDQERKHLKNDFRLG